MMKTFYGDDMLLFLDTLPAANSSMSDSRSADFDIMVEKLDQISTPTVETKDLELDDTLMKAMRGG